MKKTLVSVVFVCLVMAGAFAQSAAVKTLSLEETMRSIGASARGAPEFQWDPFFQSGTFYSEGHYASFRAGTQGETGISLVDGQKVLSSALPYLDKGVLRFPESFVTSIKKAIADEMENDLGPFRVAAIIIDPGHGGKDTGAIGTPTINGKKVTVTEKDVNLLVSNALFAQLVKAFPTKQVLMTRKDDSFISLDGRVSLANAINLKKDEAIIYISIHCNAAPFKPNARGYEIWYLPPDVRRVLINKATFDGPAEVVPILNAMKEEEFTIESTMLANAILKRFDEIIGKSSLSRGIKEEEWYVVKKANMPSVLVELGFVTNSADAALLTDSAYLKNFSEALFRGISDFIAVYEQPGGFSIIE
jgi:N-acetylmuramoyl-L-alanine amidase